MDMKDWLIYIQNTAEAKLIAGLLRLSDCCNVKLGNSIIWIPAN